MSVPPLTDTPSFAPTTPRLRSWRWAPIAEVPRLCAIPSQVLLHFSGVPLAPPSLVCLSNLPSGCGFLQPGPICRTRVGGAGGARRVGVWEPGPRPAPCRERLPEAGGPVPRAGGEASPCATCPDTLTSVLVALSYSQCFLLFALSLTSSAACFRHACRAWRANTRRFQAVAVHHDGDHSCAPTHSDCGVRCSLHLSPNRAEERVSHIQGPSRVCALSPSPGRPCSRL